jgi:hypothetical protein
MVWLIKLQTSTWNPTKFKALSEYIALQQVANEIKSLENIRSKDKLKQIKSICFNI